MSESLTHEELIAGVRRYAIRRQIKGSGHWNALLDWSDEQVGEVIGHVRSEKRAIARCRKVLKQTQNRKETR